MVEIKLRFLRAGSLGNLLLLFGLKQLHILLIQPGNNLKLRFLWLSHVLFFLCFYMTIFTNLNLAELFSSHFLGCLPLRWHSLSVSDDLVGDGFMEKSASVH